MVNQPFSFLVSLIVLGFIFFVIGLAGALIYKLLFTKDNYFSKKILQKKINKAMENISDEFEIEKIYGLSAIVDKKNKKITIL